MNIEHQTASSGVSLTPERDSDSIPAVGRQSDGASEWTRRPRAKQILLVALLAMHCGCAGYRTGTRSLYPPDVTTVYVPMFESDTLRRNLGEWLTEAVVKEIELETPFKVVNSPDADSILTGRLTSVTKHLLAEDPGDRARDVEVTFRVEVVWRNRRGDLIRSPSTIQLPPELVDFVQTGDYIAEAGQSNVSAQQKAIRRLAKQIVGTMEAPW